MAGSETARDRLAKAETLARKVNLLLDVVVAEGGKPYGWQSPPAWASFGNWMFSHALLKHDPNTALPPFTNEFLPGQGVASNTAEP